MFVSCIRDGGVILSVVEYVVLLDSLMKEHVNQKDEKCDHGRSDDWYLWFGYVFFGIQTRRCFQELTMFSSHFSLAMILMAIALKNSNMQATPQLHLVDFSKPRFPYLKEKPQILSRESHKSPKNVTLQQIMSQESQAIDTRWDCTLFIVCCSDRDRHLLLLPLSSVIKFLTPPAQSSTNDFFLYMQLSVDFICSCFLGHARATKASLGYSMFDCINNRLYFVV